MFVNLNGTVYNYITSFSISGTNNVQLPEWINEAESMNPDFFNRQLSTITYTIQATDSGKWNIDKILRNHSMIQLKDNIYNIETEAFMTQTDEEMSFDKYGFPWVITITLIAGVS